MATRLYDDTRPTTCPTGRSPCSDAGPRRSGHRQRRRATTSTAQRTQVAPSRTGFRGRPRSPRCRRAATPGQTVELTAAATDPEGTTLTYAWDFDADGRTTTGRARRLPHDARLADLLGARVRATDADGGTTVSAPSRSPPRTVRPSRRSRPRRRLPSIGQQVTFTDTSTIPTATATCRHRDLDGDGQYERRRRRDRHVIYPTFRAPDGRAAGDRRHRGARHRNAERERCGTVAPDVTSTVTPSTRAQTVDR